MLHLLVLSPCSVETENLHKPQKIVNICQALKDMIMVKNLHYK
jgi:hypothetical protein